LVTAYLFAPASIFATAASVFTTQALNETGADNAHQALRSSLFLNIAISGTMTLLVYVFATRILGAFLADPQTLQVATSGLLIIAWSAFALGIANVVCGELDAYGQSIWPALTTVAGVWLILVPCAAILAGRFGIEGVWDAYPIAYAFIAIAQIASVPVLLRLRRTHEQVPAATDRAV
jgi:Na+-driven multidrug efflux pump